MATADEFLKRAFKNSEFIDISRARQMGGTLGLKTKDSDKIIKKLELQNKIKRSRRNQLERLF